MISRPSFAPSSDTVSYISSKIDQAVQQKAQQAYRKLCDRGAIVTSVSTANDENWVEQFLRLEASNPENRKSDVADKHAEGCFFREITDRMLPKGKMTWLKTTLAGQPIAMSCKINHKNQSRSLLYKLATMHSLQQLHPGLILQLESLQYLHTCGNTGCTSFVSSQETAIAEVWPHQKAFVDLEVSLAKDSNRGQAEKRQVLQRIGRLFRK